MEKQIMEDEKVLVTREFILSGRHTTGGYNREQIKILGLMWPTVTGWIDRLVEKKITISKEDAAMYVWLKGMSKAKIRELVSNGTMEPRGRQPRRRIKVIDDAGGLKKYRDFFRSKAWISLRKSVLDTYGLTCMKCGKHGQRDNVEIHVDHIKPRSIFPELELEFNNLQVLCKDCNEAKSNKDFTDYRIKNNNIK